MRIMKKRTLTLILIIVILFMNVNVSAKTDISAIPESSLLFSYDFEGDATGAAPKNANSFTDTSKDKFSTLTNTPNTGIRTGEEPNGNKYGVMFSDGSSTYYPDARKCVDLTRDITYIEFKVRARPDTLIYPYIGLRENVVTSARSTNILALNSGTIVAGVSSQFIANYNERRWAELKLVIYSEDYTMDVYFNGRKTARRLQIFPNNTPVFPVDNVLIQFAARFGPADGENTAHYDDVLIYKSDAYDPNSKPEITDLVKLLDTPSNVSDLPSPPKGEHPKVFINSSDLPRIRASKNIPELKEAWMRVEADVLKEDSGILGPVLDAANGNHNDMTRQIIESNALKYLLDEEDACGRTAIDMMINYLSSAIYANNDDVGTRQMGQILTTTAMVYDWCYPKLTDEDKAYLIYYAEQLCKSITIGYPPNRGGSVTGHYTEAQLLRDMLSFAIAVYDDYPDVYNSCAPRVQEIVRSRNVYYQGGWYHQGVTYSAFRGPWESFAAWLYKAIGHDELFKGQDLPPYHLLYARRPDGLYMYDGDTTGQQYGTYTNNSRIWMHLSSFHKNPYFRDEFLRQKDMGYVSLLGTGWSASLIEPVEFIIFYDPDVERRSVSELPLTRYFGATAGNMIARTGWQNGIASNVAIAEMKIGNYNFNNHNHLDAGAFEIYYKGALATDSGIYQGKTQHYGEAHDMNYNKRSIAHNTMLVYDPNETFMFYTNNVANDGGQRFPNNAAEANTIDNILNDGYKTGEVLAHDFGPDEVAPDYSYLKGDITDAYTSKMKDFNRSFVFLNLKNEETPAALFVYDKVESSNPAFKKTWLLHSIEEPDIDGDTVTVMRTDKGYDGKLTNVTLLPKSDNASYEKVGGEGKEFYVDGQNYYEEPRATIGMGNSDDTPGWRVELSPKAPQATDYFLNVMQVADTGQEPLEITEIESDTLIGAAIADRVVLFGAKGEINTTAVSFQYSGTNARCLITDLDAGRWNIKKNGMLIGQAEVQKEKHTAYFEIEGGDYTLEKTVAEGVKIPVPSFLAPFDPIPGISVLMDGRKMKTDITPIMTEGRVLLPARNILEELGASIEWNEEEGLVTAVKDGTTVILKIDSNIATVNGRDIELDVPAMIQAGRTLIPLRFISENLGTVVAYNDYNRAVSVDRIERPNTQNINITFNESGRYMVESIYCSIYNPDANELQTVDENIATRWAADGDGQWITYDLGSVKTIGSVRISWHQGNQRVSAFELYTSNDNENWEKVYEGKSSGETLEMEKYEVPKGTQARYVKMIGYGNTLNTWNSPTEIGVYAN